MEIFLLIAPNLIGIFLIAIACSLACEWLDVLEHWHHEVLERNFIAKYGRSPLEDRS